jgi:TetR/AcrR family acrAB operon transcriptional repressor
MVRRTKEEAAATRERLLDTAEQVFLERGVARASLQDIASAAGVTRGAIYWHFKDKAELFIAMMDRTKLPCEATQKPADVPAQADPLELIHQMAVRPLQLLCDDERTRRVFTIAMHRTEYTDDMQSAQQRHMDAIDGYVSHIERLLSVAHERGLINPALDVGLAAHGLFALIDGLLNRATLNLDPAKAVEVVQQALGLALRGMRANP